MTKNLFIVAGETSGDMHGANLIKALKERAPDISICGMGGPRMRRAGAQIFYDTTDLSAVGITEAFSSIVKLPEVFFSIASRIREMRPDAVVLIDFPEFNLRLARRTKRAGIPVLYYITPQVWAWREGRVKLIQRFVDRLFVIFEFEKTFYERHGLRAEFVGHPLLDVFENIGRDGVRLRRELCIPEHHTVVGLLPGSRRKEVLRHFPLLMDSVREIQKTVRDISFIVACAPNIDIETVTRLRVTVPRDTHLVHGRTYEVMAGSDIGVVASGTATLEAALFGIPMVVIYKVGFLSWLVSLFVLHLENYSLVNIVAGERVVPELLQWRATPENIAEEVKRLCDVETRREVAGKLEVVRKSLGEPGAVGRAADGILTFLSERSSS